MRTQLTALAAGLLLSGMAWANNAPDIEVQASPYATVPLDSETGQPVVPESLAPGVSADGYPLLRFLMAKGSLRRSVETMVREYGWEPVWDPDTIPECLDWGVSGNYIVQGASLQDLTSASLAGYPLAAVLHIPNRVVEIMATTHIIDECSE